LELWKQINKDLVFEKCKYHDRCIPNKHN
jgi:hypothetical protein